jgi:hypothetical protein
MVPSSETLFSEVTGGRRGMSTQLVPPAFGKAFVMQRPCLASGELSAFLIAVAPPKRSFSLAKDEVYTAYTYGNKNQL